MTQPLAISRQCSSAPELYHGTRLSVNDLDLGLKVFYTLLVLLVVPVYWVKYGPANFLWFSDIALLVLLPALWLESRLLASMMAVGVLLPELAWNVDFLGRLVTGKKLIGLAGYMFDPNKSRFLRALSLFHVILPVVLLFSLARLGYDPRALMGQTLLAWIVLPVTYALTDPFNINWVFGPGDQPQTHLPPTLYLALVMLFLPLCVYLPTQLVATTTFRASVS